MRILFSTVALPGHFYPLVPLAWACRSLGHDVLVAPSEAAAELGDHLSGLGLSGLGLSGLGLSGLGLSGLGLSGLGLSGPGLSGPGLDTLPEPAAVLDPWPPSLRLAHAVSHQGIRHV